MTLRHCLIARGRVQQLLLRLIGVLGKARPVLPIGQSTELVEIKTPRVQDGLLRTKYRPVVCAETNAVGTVTLDPVDGLTSATRQQAFEKAKWWTCLMMFPSVLVPRLPGVYRFAVRLSLVKTIASSSLKLKFLS
jgi:hypothetical protein